MRLARDSKSRRFSASQTHDDATGKQIHHHPSSTPSAIVPTAIVGKTGTEPEISSIPTARLGTSNNGIYRYFNMALSPWRSWRSLWSVCILFLAYTIEMVLSGSTMYSLENGATPISQDCMPRRQRHVQVSEVAIVCDSQAADENNNNGDDNQPKMEKRSNDADRGTTRISLRMAESILGAERQRIEKKTSTKPPCQSTTFAQREGIAKEHPITLQGLVIS